MREGVRPIFGLDPETDRLALFDPLDLGRVFVEVPVPVADILSAAATTFGDLDGDGADEIVLRMSSARASSIVVLDGTTLATRAVHGFDDEETPLVLVVLDLDGEDARELAGVVAAEGGSSLVVWRLEGDALVEIGGAALETDCAPRGLRGDFDGDDEVDLVLAWEEPCAGASLLLLRAGVNDPAAPVFEGFPQPSRVAGIVSADVDGDDDDEVVAFHDSRTMTVVDWAADGSATTEELALDVDYATNGSFVHVRVGKDEGYPDWLVVSGFQEHGAPAHDSFEAAVFPGREELAFVPLARDAQLVGDFDADGLSDFRVRADLEILAYVSLP